MLVLLRVKVSDLAVIEETHDFDCDVSIVLNVIKQKLARQQLPDFRFGQNRINLCLCALISCEVCQEILPLIVTVRETISLTLQN